MRATKNRPAALPGIALVMTLMLVMLISVYLAEFTFSTVVDLRGMHNIRSSLQARNLARSAFRALQIGLLQDELDFMSGYRQLQPLLTAGALPMEDGLLVTLDIQPLDALYNLNELSGLRSNTTNDDARRELFQNTMALMRIPPRIEGADPEAPPDDAVDSLFAAIHDWIDGDEESYTEILSATGGEQGEYLNREPEIEVKNGPLDRLEELRLIRGVTDSGLPWSEWETYFAAVPKSSSPKYVLAERINANLATVEEIISFLELRRLEAVTNAIEDINAYAYLAVEIAQRLVPESGSRPKYTEKTLASRLSSISEINSNLANKVFSTANSYYRIRLVTEFNDVQARLRAVVHVNRNTDRTGKNLEVLHVTLN